MVVLAAGGAAMVLPAIGESSNGPTAGRRSGNGSVTAVGAAAMILPAIGESGNGPANRSSARASMSCKPVVGESSNGHQ